MRKDTPVYNVFHYRADHTTELCTPYHYIWFGIIFAKKHSLTWI